MANPSLEAQVAAATAYDQFFVPALFQEWALALPPPPNCCQGSVC